MSRPSLELKNKILRAGAGAGKTTTLTETFLGYAKDYKSAHGMFPRIVVTTFTRKATQELKERLLSKALKDGREDLFHYVSSKSQVQISTIHGVLSVFLARYGAAIGLTPDYKIMGAVEIKRTARKIIRKHILEEPALQELLEQYEFSGLESALLEYFSASIIKPELAFISAEEQEAKSRAYLKSLASRMRNLATSIQGETSNEKWIEYAQSWRTFAWPSDQDAFDGVFAQLESFFEFTKKPQFRKATPVFSESLHEEFEEVRQEIKDFMEEACYRPEFWQRHQATVELFDRLAKKFREDFLASKLEKGLLSMADLETLAYKIIHDVPEAAASFAQEWDFWMIDEYQDTSPIQVELLRALVGPKPYFIVGDPQQSIYLFRGARSEVFQEKLEEVKYDGGDVEVKLVNYRSSPEVLAFFNDYFTKRGPQFAAMTPDPKKPVMGNEDPVLQVIVTPKAEEDEESPETLAVVGRIQELLNDGVSPEQICVLSRTHRTLEEISKVAQDYGVPLQLHSGAGFYERREVLDALSLLKFLVNPHDNYNLVALWRSPWLALSDTEIAQFCHGSKHSYWKEALKHLSTLPAHHPIAILKTLSGLGESMGLSFTLKKAIVELGLIDYSLRIDPTGRREANLWKVVSLLSQEERRPGFNFLDFLDSNLETLSTDEGGEDSDATPVIEPRRVNFMTVHASKGLQFDHVILPAMGKAPRSSVTPMLSIHEKTGQWTLKMRDEETQMQKPSILAQEIIAELKKRETEEFDRVLYVALTRAKYGVTMLWEEDPKDRSWAAQCPLFIDEGFHQTNEYGYLVRKDRLEPVKMSLEETFSKVARPIYHSQVTEEKIKTVSVTELVTPTTVRMNVTAPELSQVHAGLARAQQGTNAHKLFEALKFNSLEKVREIADSEFKKPLEFVANSTEIPLLNIIQNGFVEWGFALKKDQSLLQGQIDLWGVVDKTAWVVDYKTGSQRYSDVAFAQLEIYAQALSQMGYMKSVDEIKLAVVYPMDEVVKIQSFAKP
jgi:ATP-dependent exoDNAse (exonuclease V) beta subunit (contains helicase and exonuclease domains)